MLRARGYKQVSLPIKLVESVEKHIKEHAHLGYVSIPEFIRIAIREKIENEVRKMIKTECFECGNELESIGAFGGRLVCPNCQSQYKMYHNGIRMTKKGEKNG